MYIPTQEERYSKAANLTLLLCFIVPSAVVAGAYSDMSFMSIIGAFTWPIAFPLKGIIGNTEGAIIISSVIQLIAYFKLRRSAMPAKKKLTIAIVWGMSFALAVKLILNYELTQLIIRSAFEQQ